MKFRVTEKNEHLPFKRRKRYRYNDPNIHLNAKDLKLLRALKECDVYVPRIVDFLDNLFWVSVMDDDFSGLPQDLLFNDTFETTIFGSGFDTSSYRTFLKNSAFYIWKWFLPGRRRKKKRDRRPKSVFRETTTFKLSRLRRKRRTLFRHRLLSETRRNNIPNVYNFGRYKKAARFDPLVFDQQHIYSVRDRLKFGSRLKFGKDFDPLSTFGLFRPRALYKPRKPKYTFTDVGFFYKYKWTMTPVFRRLTRTGSKTSDLAVYYKDNQRIIETLIPNNLFGLFVDTSAMYDTLVHHKYKRKKKHLNRGFEKESLIYFFLDPTYDRIPSTSPLLAFNVLELISFGGLLGLAFFYIFAVFRVHNFISWFLNYLDRSDKMLFRVILGPKFSRYLYNKPLPILLFLRLSLIPLLIFLFVVSTPFFLITPNFLVSNYFKRKRVPHNEFGTLVTPLERSLQKYRKRRRKRKRKNKRFKRRFKVFRARLRRRRRAKRKYKRRNKTRFRRRIVRRNYGPGSRFWKVRLREGGRSKFLRRMAFRHPTKLLWARPIRRLRFTKRKFKKYRHLRGIMSYFPVRINWRNGSRFYSPSLTRQHLRKWGHHVSFFPPRLRRTAHKFKNLVAPFSRKFLRRSLIRVRRRRRIKRRMWRMTKYGFNPYKVRKYRTIRRRKHKKKRRTFVNRLGTGSSLYQHTWGARARWKFTVALHRVYNRVYRFYYKRLRKVVFFRPFENFLANTITVFGSNRIKRKRNLWSYSKDHKSMSSHLYDSFKYPYILSLIRSFSSNIIYLFGSHIMVILLLLTLGAYTYMFTIISQPYGSTFYTQRYNYDAWVKRADENERRRLLGISPLCKH